MNNFDGDPKLIITADGSDLVYQDGQPVMDQGLENNALISLFTSPGWAGNVLLDSDQQVGSDFESQARGTLTLSKLGDIENSAVRALSTDFQQLTENEAVVVNPSGNQLSMALQLTPIGGDVSALLLTRNGLNWQSQALNPANKRV